MWTFLEEDESAPWGPDIPLPIAQSSVLNLQHPQSQ